MKYGHAYGKLWIDQHCRITRAEAFAYWEQAARFEKQAQERGDVATANYQKQIRLERENQLLELDAMEGGGI